MGEELRLKELRGIFDKPANLRSMNEIEKIMGVTKDVRFLRKISEKRKSDRVHWECCRVMNLECFSPNEVVFNFGEVGDKFYIVLAGKLSVLVPFRRDAARTLMRNNTCLNASIQEITTPDPMLMRIKKKISADLDCLTPMVEKNELQLVRSLTKGDCFGELALLSATPRSASIISESFSYLAVVSQKDYKKILRFDAERSYSERINYLRSLPFFSSLSDYPLKNLSYLLFERTFEKQQVLYNYSSPVDYVYFIRTGEFQLGMKDNLYYDSKKPVSLLKLKSMKKASKSIDLQLVIKGKNEIVGFEEIAEEQPYRLRNCVCVSNFGKVYVVNVNDLKNRNGCEAIFEAFKAKAENEHTRSNKRINSLRNIERLKLNSKNEFEKVESAIKIQEVLQKYSQRMKPSFVVSPIFKEKESKKPKISLFKGLASPQIKSQEDNSSRSINRLVNHYKNSLKLNDFFMTSNPLRISRFENLTETSSDLMIPSTTRYMRRLS